MNTRNRFIILKCWFDDKDHYNWILTDNSGRKVAQGSNWLKSEQAIRKRIKRIRTIFHSAGVVTQ